jgi:integrase
MLVFIIRFGKNLRLDFSSGYRIEEKHWTPAKNVKRSYPGAEEINADLKYMESVIHTALQGIIRSQENASAKQLKYDINLALNRATEVETPIKSFSEFAELFIEESKATKKWGTVKTYIQTVNRLRDFNPSLDFKDFTIEFYYKFVNYLTDDCGIYDNTVGKHIKNLKAILNDATERGINTCYDFRKKKFRTFRSTADTVYLTLSELEKLYTLNLTRRPGLERVRDLFVIGCYTGLRFSDLSRITPANIMRKDGKVYISIRTLKTGHQVVIPLNSVSESILNRYDGQVPPAIANQKMNDYLKEIGKKAGLSKEVQYTRTKGGIVVTLTDHKYNLITTHTARRSFATNAYLSGVPALAIMKITGHKTEGAFMAYIKAGQEENAINLAKHNFFQ